MFSMIALLISISPNGFAGPVEQCDTVAADWLMQLETNGCSLDSTFTKGASAGCAAIPEEGWKRELKAARRALYQHCGPTVHGLGDPQRDPVRDDESPSCGEYILLIRGDTAELSSPGTPTMGVDQMMGIMGAAVWTCFAPQSMTKCETATSTQTSSVDLHAIRKACQSLTTPPLDPIIRTLALSSGVLSIIPEQQVAHLDGLILAKQNDRLTRLKEKTIFQQAQIDEVRRAQQLKNKCLAATEELVTLEETHSAREACTDLKALWRGEDSVRVQQETDGIIAPRFREKMSGQCLNTDSLSVSDPSQIDGQLSSLLEHTKSLVVIRFSELIQTDWNAAEALLDAHRNHMDPDWVKDAVDQVIEAEG